MVDPQAHDEPGRYRLDESFERSQIDCGMAGSCGSWATPFSGFRWSAFRKHCGFKGRAIYLDIDMIVLADIAELWHHPIEPAFCRREKSVDVLLHALGLRGGAPIPAAGQTDQNGAWALCAAAAQFPDRRRPRVRKRELELP